METPDRAKRLIRCFSTGQSCPDRKFSKEIYDIDNLPLLRNEKPDGSVDMKIPDSMMPLVMFVAWLNEKEKDI